MRYTVHQFYFEGLGRYYLPLPKFSMEQLLPLIRHLESNGFSVVTSVGDGDWPLIRATAGRHRLTVDGTVGLAWSNMDLLDVIAPCVPELLRIERKTKMTSNPFFLTKTRGEVYHIQLLPRLETRRTWKELRRTAGSGLTPDEHRIVCMLLENTRGRVEAVTNFPVEGSKVFRVGRRSYFRSQLETDEFVRTLDSLETAATTARRSFLPMNSILVLRQFAPPSERQLRDIFDELGEWCFLTP